MIGRALLVSAVALCATGAQTREETYDRFAAAFAALDAERVSLVYAEDAVYLPPGGDMLRGRAAIRERFAEGFDEDRARRHTRRITFELVRRESGGDLRNDIGYYTIVSNDPAGHEDRFRGKYLKVWRRDRDGVWRILIDSYSSAPSR